MNFSLMDNLLNWQMWELCLGKAPKKNQKHTSLKRACIFFYKISTNITQ